MKLLLLLLPGLLVLPAAQAQTRFVVSPAAYATVEAPSNNTYPFYNNTFSYMQLHDDLAGPPILLNQIALRRDGTSSTTINAFTVNLTLRISTAATTAATPMGAYASNHGPDILEVITASNVNFPASTKPATPPAPFAYVMPFSMPFIYKGTGSLCWEVRVHSTTSTQSNPMDAASNLTNGSAFGTRTCLATGATAAAYISGVLYGAINPASHWASYANVRNLPAVQAFLLNVGLDTLRWGPLPLPFDFATYGAPGCKLFVAPILTIAGGTTDTSGSGSTSGSLLVFPRDPLFAGQPFYMQAMGFDPGRPVFPLTLTDAAKVVVPDYIVPSCRIYSSGDDQATGGTPGITFGLVTQFGYR